MPLTITCPSCATVLDLDDQYRDWTVRCPDCRHEFVARAPVPVGTRDLAPEPRPSRPANTAGDCNAAGIGLTVAGVLQLCVCGFIVFFNAVLRPDLPQPINPNPDEEENETIFAIVVGGWGLFQAGLMILGAVALRRRRGFSLAMAGAVAAVIPLNVCCFTALPFGVWALVLLGRPDVRAAFAAEREPYDPEPDSFSSP